MAEGLNRLDSRIIAILKCNGGQASMRDVLSEVGSDKALAELRVMRMARLEILAMVKEGKDYSLKLSHDAATTLCESGQQGMARDEQVIEVVATIPFSVQRGRAGSDGLLSIEEAFGFLLKKANHVVKLSLPFPEESIITHYASHLKELARRGVRIQVLTREIDSMVSTGNARYLALGKALVRLSDIYRSSGNGHLLEVRDFHRSLGNHDSAFHYESTHAKILIVDSSDAYVGSGEFRVNSLYNNFELGFLVSGSPVQQVEYAYNLIWDYAEAYSYEMIQESLAKIVPRNQVRKGSFARRWQ